jgi:ABC-type Na+ transport system ATPase subunit NatA
MREVETLCDRVILMSRGKIVADGTAAEIATQFAVDDLEGAFLAVAAELRGEGPR